MVGSACLARGFTRLSCLRGPCGLWEGEGVHRGRVREAGGPRRGGDCPVRTGRSEDVGIAGVVR